MSPCQVVSKVESKLDNPDCTVINNQQTILQISENLNPPSLMTLISIEITEASIRCLELHMSQHPGKQSALLG